jgi:hypothetical protein
MQARAAFPRSIEMSELEAQAHLEAWIELSQRVGRERFEKAIRRCIAELAFFPKRHEIEERIPPLVRLVGCADESCQDCKWLGSSECLVQRSASC